ncbi:MAG: hypothetical protein WBW38_19595, partial [Candidatus Sulfotelmatobacter sp.]
RRNRSGMLWRMLVLELWHRNFMEARSDWATARRAPEVFASEITSLPHAAASIPERPGSVAN